jgi:RNA polymerase sigma-70 factor (ECF subfamily)
VNFEKEIVEVYFALIAIAERSYYPHDKERAHDLAADAVEKALKARESYDVSRPLLPWCRAIMRNLWMNTEQRLENVNTQRLGEWESEGGVVADQCAIVHDVIDLINRLRRRSVSVDSLVEFAKGYSLDEIATSRGLPLGTVKRRIHDARVMLSKLVNVK